MTLLTRDSVAEILKQEGLNAANFFGRTGRAHLSAWIKQEGDTWLVWNTDERADVMDITVTHWNSEQAALENFLARARSFKASDAQTVNPSYRKFLRMEPS